MVADQTLFDEDPVYVDKTFDGDVSVIGDDGDVSVFIRAAIDNGLNQTNEQLRHPEEKPVSLVSSHLVRALQFTENQMVDAVGSVELYEHTVPVFPC